LPRSTKARPDDDQGPHISPRDAPVHSSGHRRRDEEPPSTIGLPYLDRHWVVIGASRAQAWLALRTYATHGLGIADTNPLGSLLATHPRSGFEITIEQPPRQLVVRGRHRFAEYAIVFELRASNSTSTQLNAYSYARFIGVAGAVYRRLVLGTRLHALATDHMLRVVRRDCIEAPRPSAQAR
jgi:hypothetical protein